MAGSRPLRDHRHDMATRRDRHRHRLPLRNLRRSDRPVIAGVCSGLAEAVRVDPIIVRVAFVVLVVAGGTGIWLYLALWWFMPDTTGQRGIRLDELGLRATDLRQPLAIGLIVGGTLLVLSGTAPFFSDAFVWPLALAGFGVAVLWSRSDADDRARFTRAANRLP